jgi:hypothetical protein
MAGRASTVLLSLLFFATFGPFHFLASTLKIPTCFFSSGKGFPYSTRSIILHFLIELISIHTNLSNHP